MYSDRDKSWPIFLGKSHSKSVKTYHGNCISYDEEDGVNVPILLPPPPTVRWSDGIRCCRSDGSGLVCFVVINPRVLELILSFFVSYIILTPQFKFVLDYKIKELKQQIEPSEIEVSDMKDQVCWEERGPGMLAWRGGGWQERKIEQLWNKGWEGWSVIYI